MASPSTVPAFPPPAGHVSNFVDPINHTNELIACNVVLLIIGILIVAARVASRTVLTDWRLGWDDWTIILSLVGTIVFTGFIIETTTFGLGRHIWDVPKSLYSPHYLWWIMATFASCPASYYFVKVSILLFYLRVFPPSKRTRYLIYALLAYCTLYYGVAFFTIVTLCNIKNREWDIASQMNCFAYGKLTLAIGGLDLVADALILSFPIPMVLKLKVSWQQRVYLLFVFLAGIIASIACVIRVGFAASARGTTDATMSQYYVVVLFCIEHWFALIAACMPTLGPLFRWMRPRSWRHTTLVEKHSGKEAFRNEPEKGHRVWPKLQVDSQDDTLTQGSLRADSPTSKNMGLSYWQSTMTSGDRSEVSGVSKQGIVEEFELQDTPPWPRP